MYCPHCSKDSKVEVDFDHLGYIQHCANCKQPVVLYYEEIWDEIEEHNDFSYFYLDVS